MGVKNDNITTGKIEIYCIASGPMWRKSRTIENLINPKTEGERTKRLIGIGKTKWQELVNPLKKENFKINKIIIRQATKLNAVK